ncbi:MAG: type II toxin-antitoxin system RelE/ParE family toxin [Selenomonadaceae bacterium]|nr:type II toxin-antitoxin system RelE/ParE family toxin [Selenomonadaceae bacterium]
MAGIKMRIDISPRALEDLESIKNHIEEKLQNPSSAKTIVTDILYSIKSLDKFPKRGASLNSLIDTRTDYRFIQSHNYVIFYRTNNENVFIVRILYKHRDFMKIFFNDTETIDSNENMD